MKRILVVANETVAGKPLIDAVRDRAAGDPVDVHVICPQNQPRHGYVIYESMVRDAAENRLQMTIALLREAGIQLGMTWSPLGVLRARSRLIVRARLIREEGARR